ncbi:MAG: pentapeptide repeat-containing protein [Holophaga sp.]|nr:pentapeptide repeat-containing protein [Holophaga sp.]
MNRGGRGALSGQVFFCLLVGSLHPLPAHASGRGVRPSSTAAKPAPKAGSVSTSTRDALRAKLAAKKAACTGTGVPAKQVNGYLIQAGADLRKARLRGADLRHCVLTGADLRGADLRETRLDGAKCHGARLEGARLYLADISLAEGLDTTGALPHPFFLAQADDPVGSMTFLATDDGTGLEPGLPRSLVSTPRHDLFWLAGTGNHIRHVYPTGCAFQVSGEADTRLFALVRDAKDRLWSFGDRTFGTLSVVHLEPGDDRHHVTYSSRPSKFVEVPSNVVAATDGSVFISLPGRTFRGIMQGSKFQLGMSFHDPAWDLSPAVRMAQNRSGSHLFCYSHDRDFILIVPTEGGRASRVDLPGGAGAHRMAMGAGDEMWLTLAGANGICALDLAKGTLAVRPFEPGPTPREAFGIALGPDGTLWFTEKAGRIGRINQDGFLKPFDLAPGDHPEEILASHDGRMFFTLEGQQRIGAIRAVSHVPKETKEGKEGKEGKGEAEETGAERAADSWDVPVFRPREVRRAELKDEQRRELHLQRMLRAESRPVVPVEPPKPPKLAMPVTELKEVPAPVPSPAVRKLEAMDMLLTPEAVAAILRKHGSGGMAGKSRFAAEHSTPEGLEKLLAECLAETEVGRILDYGPTFERNGEAVTFCGRKQVGRLQDGTPAHRFKVVTRWCRDAGGHYQEVTNAYPIWGSR